MSKEPASKSEVTDLIRPREAARLLPVSQREIYRLVERGELVAYRRKGYKGRSDSIFIDKQSVREWNKKYLIRIYPKLFPANKPDPDTAAGRDE